MSGLRLTYRGFSAGDIAVVNSRIEADVASRVRLIRGKTSKVEPME